MLRWGLSELASATQLLGHAPQHVRSRSWQRGCVRAVSAVACLNGAGGGALGPASYTLRAAACSHALPGPSGHLPLCSCSFFVESWLCAPALSINVLYIGWCSALSEHRQAGARANGCRVYQAASACRAPTIVKAAHPRGSCSHLGLPRQQPASATTLQLLTVLTARARAAASAGCQSASCR